MMNIFLKRVFEIDAPDFEESRDLMIELHHGSNILFTSHTHENVVHEMKIHARSTIEIGPASANFLHICIKQDEVLTKTILSKVKILLPTESCTKVFKLAHFTKADETIFGKVDISFEVIEKEQKKGVETESKVEVEKKQIQKMVAHMSQLDLMIATLQTDLKRLANIQEQLMQPKQQQLQTKDQLPHFLQMGNIPPVILRSVTSAKQLRINHSGRVDSRGNYGQLTLFHVFRIDDNRVRLQSIANRKRHLRIDNMNVDGLGGQGNLTEFYLHYMGRHTFAFESVYYPNHYLASDQTGRCSVLIGDQPNLTRFVMIVTGDGDD